MNSDATSTVRCIGSISIAWLTALRFSRKPRTGDRSTYSDGDAGFVGCKNAKQDGGYGMRVQPLRWTVQRYSSDSHVTVCGDTGTNWRAEVSMRHARSGCSLR